MPLVGGVANVSTPFKRALLREFFWSAEEKGGTAYDAIKCALRCKVEHAGQGIFLVGSTALGNAVTYQLPTDGRGYSPSEILEAVEELLTRHEAATAALIAAGTPTPTEAQILAEMLALLVPIREVFSDYKDLRAC